MNKEKSAPTSIVTVKQPVQNFHETKTYEDVRERAEEKTIFILHLYGYGGNGKSELLRKLAQLFPYKNRDSSVFVKWHIQCDEKEPNICQKLTGLLKRMRESNLLLGFENNYQNSEDEEKDVAFSIVSDLFSSTVPILIIIEDITQRDPFLEEFLRCVDTQSVDDRSKVHVYLATRLRTSVLLQDECACMDNYIVKNLSGFSGPVGVKFLLSGKLQNEENVEFANKIFEKFSGSPLGLQVVKRYCDVFKLSYKEYFDELKTSNEQFCLEKDEEDFIKDEFGDKAQPIFQTIIKPFKTNPSSKTREVITWNVLSCLSYFHHDKLPKCVLTKCFQVQGENKIQSQKNAGRLISSLEDFGMCDTSKDNDNYDEISFHQIILHAFRSCAFSSEERNKHLVNAVWVMASLLTKNIEEKEILYKMHRLFRHVQTLLEHVFEAPVHISNQEEVLLFNMVVSHVFETAGAIALTIPSLLPLGNNYFKHAYEIIWHRDDCFSLSEKGNQDLQQVVAYVVDRCKSSSNKLPSGFITEYASKVFLCNEVDLKFLTLKIADAKKLEELKSLLGMSQDIHCEIIKCLRDCGVFLHEKKHKEVFFLERLASIFHSWSRVAIFKEVEKTSETIERATWFSSLSNAICEACHQSFQIKLLFEHLSYITRSLYISIEKNSNLESLTEARNVCMRLLDLHPHDVSADAYLNGLLVEVYGFALPKKRNQILRYTVRINEKFLHYHSKHNLSYENAPSNTNRACELLKLASHHFYELSSAPTSIIQCGKYFAAIKDYVEAMKCFEIYFTKIESDNNFVYQYHSWAVCKYAKVVCAGEIRDKIGDAIIRVQEVLPDTLQFRQGTSKKVGVDLRKVLTGLKSLKQGNSSSCGFLFQRKKIICFIL